MPLAEGGMNGMKICIKWRTEPPKFIPLTSGRSGEIDSLIGMSRYKEGLEVYQNTKSFYSMKWEWPFGEIVKSVSS